MKALRMSALRNGRLYRPGNIPGTHFCQGRVDPKAIVLPEWSCRWRSPVTPSGIEPANCRLVAQCLNSLRHRTPTASLGTWFRLCVLKHALALLDSKTDSWILKREGYIQHVPCTVICVLLWVTRTFSLATFTNEYISKSQGHLYLSKWTELWEYFVVNALSKSSGSHLYIVLHLARMTKINCTICFVSDTRTEQQRMS